MKCPRFRMVYGLISLAFVLMFWPLPGMSQSFLPKPTRELSLSLDEAILGAIRNNHDLEIRKMAVAIEETDINGARGEFDPRLGMSISSSDRLGKSILPAGILSDSVTNRSDSEITLTKKSPAGTQTQLSLEMTRNRSNRSGNLFNPRIGVDLVKPLRQGAGATVNLVALRKQQLETQITRHELEGFLLELVANVEQRYWNLFLSRKELEIVRETHRLAVVQLEDVDKRISVGSIPESERAAAEAELALREEDLINAQSAIDKSRIALLRLTNANPERFWDFEIHQPDYPPDLENEMIQVENHLESAVTLRPDLLEARVQLEKGTLDVVKTRNGLLPRLDLFMNLGRTGYSRSFHELKAAFSEEGYDLQAGLRYEIPLHRRQARAEHQRTTLTKIQLEESLRNLTQLAQEDVLNAYLEVQRTLHQRKATAKTKAKQLEKLRVEEVRFQVGKNTAFQVAQAQRDYSASRIAEMKTEIAFIIALTELYRLDGSLCRRRNCLVGVR